MTNGEKLKEIFPYLESDDTDLVKVLNIDNLKSWWNTEYKEPTTKNNLKVDVDKLIVDCEKMSFDIDFFNKPLKVVALDAVKNIANELSSVTPQEPRKGHWICDGKGRSFADYHCSECGLKLALCGQDIKQRQDSGYSLFCGGCGADMREVVEE